MTLQVNTIAALKALSVAGIASGDVVRVLGFDNITDGCGGDFQYRSGTVPTPTLDGVLMAASTTGHWVRVDAFDGPVHTRWCGIRPDPNANLSFDWSSFAVNNRTRWNNMVAYCERPVLDIGAVEFVNSGVWIDPGIHDFAGGGLDGGRCMPITGSGRGVSVLRCNITSGVFLQVGTVGAPSATTYSGYSDCRDFTIYNFQMSTGTDVGLSIDNVVRAVDISHLSIFNFGAANLVVNSFAINIHNLWLQSGYRTNLKIGPTVSTTFVGLSRFDDQRAPAGDNVLVDGDAAEVNFYRCEIQRSYGRGLRFTGARMCTIESCFFEGNNRNNDSAPDIWIDGDAVANVKIDRNYFTGTGRANSTGSRAISIRSVVPASARFQITNNAVSNSTQGSFAFFIDDDSASAHQIAAWNNISPVGNSILGAVVKTGLAAGTW